MSEEKRNSLPVQVLILQHPSEARNGLSTVKVITESLPHAIHKVGLSWRSFKHALGTEADPKEWAVLFAGTKKSSEKWSKMAFAITTPKDLLGKKNSIKGIVLLDGNWAQSKTLWWRNPWLLKLNRMVLNSTPRARYHAIRKEPRKNCLSTAESAIEVLKHLGNVQAAEKIDSAFSIFMESILQESPKKSPARTSRTPSAQKIDVIAAETTL